MDDVSGYPTMIDPSTGYEWGYNQETGGTFEGMDWVDWPTDGDGEPLDPSYETDLSIFGVSPVTGVNFGIDPSTNEPWHCNIIDSEGVVYNPP